MKTHNLQREQYEELLGIGTRFDRRGWHSLTVNQYSMLCKFARDYPYLRSYNNHTALDIERISHTEHLAEWYYNLLLDKGKRHGWKKKY